MILTLESRNRSRHRASKNLIGKWLNGHGKSMTTWSIKVSRRSMCIEHRRLIVVGIASDDGEWTKDIPPALINFQAVEERALSDPPEQLRGSQLQHFRRQQSALLQIVPSPPTLPRHLEKVILNSTPKELEGTVGGAAGDDNSILPVPNHVVLNHLTASAIRNGTLAVGTTTRYKRKVRPGAERASGYG